MRSRGKSERSKTARSTGQEEGWRKESRTMRIAQRSGREECEMSVSEADNEGASGNWRGRGAEGA